MALVSLIETSRWTNNQPELVGCNTLEFWEEWFKTTIESPNDFSITIPGYYATWKDLEDGEQEYVEYPATFALEA